MNDDQLAAEQRARVLIDRQLSEAGWFVQSRSGLNLFAGQGVAVRETIMAPGHGRCPVSSGSRRCTPKVSLPR